MFVVMRDQQETSRDLRSSKKPAAAAAAASLGEAVTGTSRHGQRAGAAGLQNPVASNSLSATSGTDPADTGGSDTEWNEEDGVHFETGERNLESLPNTALAADRCGISHGSACAIINGFSTRYWSNFRNRYKIHCGPYDDVPRQRTSPTSESFILAAAKTTHLPADQPQRKKSMWRWW